MRWSRILLFALALAAIAPSQRASVRNWWQPGPTRDPMILWTSVLPQIGTRWWVNVPPSLEGGWPRTWLGTKRRYLMFATQHTYIRLWGRDLGKDLVAEGILYVVPFTMMPMPVADQAGPDGVRLEWDIPNDEALIGAHLELQVLSWWDNPEGDDLLTVSNSVWLRLGL